MKNLGIDFKKVGTKMGGHAIGAIAAGKLSNTAIVQKITNPTYRGLAMAAFGYLAVPFIATKMGHKAKGKEGLIESIGEGIGIVGLLQAGHNVKPDLIPGVAGISGYEQNPIMGLGEIGELTDSDVSGYEDSPVSGYEDSPVSGNEEYDVSGYDDDVSGYDED